MLTPQTLETVRRVSVGVRTQPLLTMLSLMLTDILAITLANSTSVIWRWVNGGSFEFQTYIALLPFLGLFIAAFAAFGLYQGSGLNPVEELRLATLGITLVYALLGAASFFLRAAELYSRLAFIVALILSLLFVPLARAIIRGLFSRAAWWGVPVVILGAGETGKIIAQNLQKQPGLGLKLVAFLDDDPSKHGELEKIPVIGGLELAPILAEQYGVRHALLAMPGAKRERLLEIIEDYGAFFPRLYLVPDLLGVASLWASAKDYGGLLALEVRQNLLQPLSKRVKRTMDLVLVLLALPLLLPLTIFIAIAICLESKGSVFFTQERIGRGGKPFRAYKFRSMVQNAEHVLQTALEQNTTLREEWTKDQKLRHDPRVTKIGWLIRKTSLDEMPQLWNVLLGEMSLVGPRPIVQNEISRYGEAFKLYTKVTPGLTGMWQVNGRNNTTYAERVRFDAYYARNWSVWLDIYILARTFRAVIRAEGAY
jgi:Undecaprenyl-phosphate galactose phosphotransferase WbaP